MVLARKEVDVPTPGGVRAKIERYEIRDNRLLRQVLGRSGKRTETDAGRAPARGTSPGAMHALADLRYLKAKTLPGGLSVEGKGVRIADLYSGLGALTLGAIEAARVIGLQAEVVLAADHDPAPLEVLRNSLGLSKETAQESDLGQILEPGDGPETTAERKFLGKQTNELDILLAGPPCQGHSRLNNHTRHDDPRNDLYGRVGRFVALRRPRLCLIENVDSIVHDERESAKKTAELLIHLGYEVDEGKVALHDLGIPQKRRRHILVATARGERSMAVKDIVDAYSVPERESRNVEWAIGDLESPIAKTGIDAPTIASDEKLERMEWLLRENKFNLPNTKRPICHQKLVTDAEGNEREHSYTSMYGRLRWEQPAQTITSGYGSMGQGRYVHPSKARTLTPHEAARLQFIPDFMRLDTIEGRGKWAKMIGNVAPMKLSYVFVLEFLR